MARDMIELEAVSKTYAGATRPAVSGISLTVDDESVLVVLGESGSGKTTVLKLINRLIELSSGRVRVGGEDVAGLDPIDLRRRIGYAFQGVGLFPHMSVADNIAVVPRLLGWTEADVSSRVDELLELMNLAPAEYRGRFPHALSGGQRQRVGVARALAARSRVLLMDEPFGALDPLTRDELQEELMRLQGTLGLTIVLVTHDVSEALRLADRIAVMKDGMLLGHDTPARLLASPPNEYVGALMAMPKREAEMLNALTGEPIEGISGE